MDLSTIRIEDLQKEIRERNRPKPLFVRNGKEYYDVKGYQQLIEYYDEIGEKPFNASALEYDRSGALKSSSAEPSQVVVNLEAIVSNRVWTEVVKVGDTEKTFHHLVNETRTVFEAEGGNVTVQFIPEYILEIAPRTKSGFKVTRGTVSREDFLRNYTDAFGIDDMLRILGHIDSDKTLSEGNATLSLPPRKE